MDSLETSESECIGCSCTDMQACEGGCWWLAVDRERGKGACCNCRDSLPRFRELVAAAPTLAAAAPRALGRRVFIQNVVMRAAS